MKRVFFCYYRSSQEPIFNVCIDMWICFTKHSSMEKFTFLWRIQHQKESQIKLFFMNYEFHPNLQE